MSDQNTPAPEGALPQEVIEQTKEMVQEGLNLFSHHAQKLSEDLARFNERQKAAQQRIRNGGKRTSGRII